MQVLDRVKTSLRKEEVRAGYLFMIPALIFFPLFLIYPLFNAFFVSMTRGYMRGEMRFVGLENYLHAFRSVEFWSVMRNTAVYSVGSVVLGLTLGLFAAVVVASGVRFKDLWRVIFYLPVITPWIIVSLVWRWMLHPQLGVLNFLLSLVSLGPFRFLSDARLAMTIVILIGVWKQFGYFMLIYLAGMMGIPDTYYEAATIDGASSFQKFFRITLPLLKPTTLFLLVTSVVATFQVFGQIYVMTAGGPGRATTVMVYTIYTEAFQNLRLEYASALSYIMFLILIVVSVIQFKFLGKGVDY